MGNVFSSSEVVGIAIEIEKNGRDFYREVLKVSKSAEASGIFEFLAGEEEKHIKRFQYILSQVEKYEPNGAYPDEYFSYLKSLSESYVFTKKDKGIEIAKNVKNEKEAVELGIGFEKSSIKFYEGIKKVVLQREQKVIDILIEEENGHLNKLTELRGKI